MGMAASQARLLTLTGRLSDVEMKAQAIEAQKVALATQRDSLYQEYCDALDATSINVQYTDGLNSKYVQADFSNLCSFNLNRPREYALRDNNTGKIIVSEKVAETYQQFKNDKYTFAYAMVGFSGNFNWQSGRSDADEDAKSVGIGIGNADDGFNYKLESNGKYSLYMTEAEQKVYDANTSDTDLVKKYTDIDEASTMQEKRDALEIFRDYLYKKYPNEIFEQMNLDKSQGPQNTTDKVMEDKTWDDIKPEFNFYLHLFDAISNTGGCQAIDKEYESGEKGNEWLNGMVESGQVTIQVWDATGNSKEWSDTTPATSINNNYLQKLSDDKNLKKAEIKYQHELDIIKDKDSKFDRDLSNLETERTSITTEMDAIKQVKNDNIDRTFGIFS